MSTNVSIPASFFNSNTNSSTTAFQILCGALVMIMTPAVGLLYASFAQQKNRLAILQLSMIAYAIVSVQYILFGFSFSFSETSSLFFGDFNHAFFLNVSWNTLPLTAPDIPVIVFAFYQMQFATITSALCFGSVIERVRILPSLIFLFIWTTLIYDPIIFWTWSARGWIRNLSCISSAADMSNIPCQIGAIDFAGGGPIHISSGAAALALCIFVGPRKKWLEKREESKAINLLMNSMATVILWFGWFGFNAGSALDTTPRAAYAAVLTTVAASAGALTWMVLDYVETGKTATRAFNSGVIAGLVGITPASGFVPVWSSLLIGAITSFCCFHGVRLKLYFGYDDSADSFGIHGIGGILGSILTAVFASKNVASLDSTIIPGGPIMDGAWAVVLYNLIAALIIALYSYLGTFLILSCIERLGYQFRFRLNNQEEDEGQDINQLGESIDFESVDIPAKHVIKSNDMIPLHNI